MANELMVVKYDLDAMQGAQELLQVLQEELSDDYHPEFPTAKTPSSGMTAWSIKATKDDEDPEITKTIEGVIVHAHKTNAYWKDSLDAGGNAQPDCRSLDGVTGIDSDGFKQNCATCPHNQFGSDANGRGKACKNSRVLYVLRQDDYLPIKLTLAPTGNKYYDKYVENLVIPKKRGQKPRRTKDVMTKIGLRVETSSGGQKYSVPTFECVGDLDDDSKAAIRGYADSLVSAAAAMQEHDAPQTAQKPVRDDFVEVNDPSLPF